MYFVNPYVKCYSLFTVYPSLCLSLSFPFCSYRCHSHSYASALRIARLRIETPTSAVFRLRNSCWYCQTVTRNVLNCITGSEIFETLNAVSFIFYIKLIICTHIHTYISVIDIALRWCHDINRQIETVMNKFILINSIIILYSVQILTET